MGLIPALYRVVFRACKLPGVAAAERIASGAGPVEKIEQLWKEVFGVGQTRGNPRRFLLQEDGCKNW